MISKAFRVGPVREVSLSMNTRAWVLQTWISFVVSLAGSIVGIAYLPVSAWVKAFVAIAFFFTIAQTFTLAKTVRDEHESRNFPPRPDRSFG